MRKNLYLLLACSLSASVAFSQTSKKDRLQADRSIGAVKIDKESKSPTTTHIAKGTGSPIWENGFEDAGEWTFSNESTPEPLGWVITDDVNAVPNFAQVQFAIPLQFPGGADNDFAFINMDAGGSAASFQVARIEYTEPIDLMGVQNVSLEYDFVTRNFATMYYVEVSVDDGLSWIQIPVHEDITTNVDSDNPDVFNINLTPFINGANTIRLRFFVDANWGWFWAVDNVRIFETPALDLVLQDAYYDEYILLEQGEDPVWMDIDYIPQVEYNSYREGHVRPLTFVADVLNNGSSDLENVVFTVDVTTPSGMEQYSSDAVTISSAESVFITIDDIVLDAFATGGELGDYSVDFSTSYDGDEGDAFPDDNGAPTKSFSVNTERMENHGGDSYDGWYTLGQAAIFANQFTLEEEAEVNYIQFMLVDANDEPTQLEEEVFLNLRSGSVFDDETTERFFGEDELAYEIMPGDISVDGIATYLTVMFDPITLDPGVLYQAEAESQELGSNYAFFGATFERQIGAGFVFNFLGANGPAWSGLGDGTPNIHAGFMGPVSTEDNWGRLDFYMGQNFPNPVENGSTRISWRLENPEENISFSIVDNNGKLVYQKDLGDRPAGQQEDIVLDDLRLAAGIYQYGLKAGNQKVVRKMVITK
ncbi:MAG: T9SS type A sorting domain-containing protein [Bacteroidota bacterium]